MNVINTVLLLVTYALALHITLMRKRNKRLDIDEGVPGRRCDHPGCNKLGEYRAPKSPSNVSEFYWFCLEHVRNYNRAWNYYKGMKEPEIEAEIRNDTVWRRPTWPMGGNARTLRSPFDRVNFNDSFGIFGETRGESASSFEETKYDVDLRRSFSVMDIRPPTTLDQLKSRYKELVKKLHPDVNGGNSVAEERLKDINQAYAKLKKVVLS